MSCWVRQRSDMGSHKRAEGVEMSKDNENVERGGAEPGFAIEGNLVILQLTKASFGLDFQPQKKSKVSTWGSFEPLGLLPVAIQMHESEFHELEDGSRVLSESGAGNLLFRMAKLGVPSIRASYHQMLQREQEPQGEEDF